jgi:DNA-binding MarR family transcriptional regulator
MSRAAAGPKPLTRAEAAFWRSFMRALVVVPRVLDDDLDRAERLSLNQYGVLMFLSEAEGWRMRIGHLAERTCLTISGMTRLVSRLAEDGLVERRRCDDDGRGFDAVLTQRGFERLQRAYPAHLASARRRVIDHLGSFDLEALSAAFMGIGEANYEAAN